jgi:hypothetical protein
MGIDNRVMSILVRLGVTPMTSQVRRLVALMDHFTD